MNSKLYGVAYCIEMLSLTVAFALMLVSCVVESHVLNIALTIISGVMILAAIVSFIVIVKYAAMQNKRNKRII